MVACASESSVTAISWIPSEAISGLPKLPFEVGIGHYDEPPPETVAPGDLDALRDADRFREANELKAWIEVEDDRIVAQGYSGRGLVGATTFSFGPKQVVVPGVAFDVLQAEPVVSDGSVRFVQTVGGRAGFPAPRRVKQKPFVRINSATAWTTLALTINADGTSEHELVGASSFPRHWIYDRDGALTHKSGIVDFATWYREAHGEHTPWGDEDSEAFVTQAETKLERQLSRWLMQEEHAPERLTLEPGSTLSSRARRAETCTCCSTACSRSRWTATRWPRSGPGPSSGSAPCSRAVSARRPCGRRPAAGSPSSTRNCSIAAP